MRTVARLAAMAFVLSGVVCSGASHDTSSTGAGGAASGAGGTGVGSLSNGSGGSGCTAHCSADLHDLVDCQGNVLKSCPLDQGCAPDGTCIAACSAAAANKSAIGCDYFT